MENKKQKRLTKKQKINIDKYFQYERINRLKKKMERTKEILKECETLGTVLKFKR